MQDCVWKQFNAEIKAGAGRVRRFVISTSTPDRDNDTIAVAGWKLDNYRRNPVVLWAHDYQSLPLGRAVSVAVDGDKLVADAEFADHDMANAVLKLIDGGFLRATSVGFRPLTSTYNNARGGTDYTAQELLEFSLVPVPANPEALIQAKSLTAIRRYFVDANDVVLDLRDDDLVLDVIDHVPASIARRHVVRQRGEPFEPIDVTAVELHAAMREAHRDMLREIVADATVRAINRLRGRVD